MRFDFDFIGDWQISEDTLNFRLYNIVETVINNVDC